MPRIATTILLDTDRHVTCIVESLIMTNHVTLNVTALEKYLTQIVEAAQAALAIVRTPRREQTSDQLYGTIEELITQQPRKFSELKFITRAPDNMIKSVLIRLQRDSPMCVNLGGSRRALWAIVTPELLEKLRGK